LGEPLVRLFLSAAFVPAIPGIRLYMLGDFFRVWVSLSMFCAFAAGKPGRYAAIEIATIAIMVGIMLLLMGSGQVWAPQIAYAAAYGIMALLLGSRQLLSPGPRLRGLWRQRGERRTPLQGSVPRPR